MLTSSINCIEERTDPRAANASGGAFNYPLLCLPAGNDFAESALETRPETCFRGYDSPRALRPRAERGTS